MADMTNNLSLTLPGANATSKRLADIQAVRTSLTKIDSVYGAPNGIATLDSNGLVPSSQLPSYVDDVVECLNQSLLPITGEAGKIYVTSSDGKVYRWSGATYAYVNAGSVDSVNGKIGVVDLTKADIGLENVNNTSDTNKPISTATQTALNSKGNKNLIKNKQNSDYTCVASDDVSYVLHTDATAVTYSIPTFASVPYTEGTVLTFVNKNAAGGITISCGDVMYQGVTGSTGNRTLAANGECVAVLIDVVDNVGYWTINGNGLS